MCIIHILPPTRHLQKEAQLERLIKIYAQSFNCKQDKIINALFKTINNEIVQNNARKVHSKGFCNILNHQKCELPQLNIKLLDAVEPILPLSII